MNSAARPTGRRPPVSRDGATHGDPGVYVRPASMRSVMRCASELCPARSRQPNQASATSSPRGSSRAAPDYDDVGGFHFSRFLVRRDIGIRASMAHRCCRAAR